MNNTPELRVVPQEIVLNVLSFSSFDYLYIYQRVSKFFKEHLKPFEFNAAKNENLRHIKISTKEALEKVKHKTTKQRSREEYFIQCNDGTYFTFDIKWIQRPSSRKWDSFFEGSDGEDDDDSPNSDDPDDDGLDEELMF
jgi:hypothetical protein